jgi:hypothetical protein
MIPVERLHYKLDMRLNRLASNEHQYISEEDKDFALNEARLRLVKNKLGPDKYGHGLDGFRERYMDLESLIVPHEKLSVTKVKTGSRSIYEAAIATTQKPFMLPVDAYTVCTLGKCSGRTVWIENIAPHSDVPVFLNSTHLQPSFGYQVTFATLSDDRFQIYTDDPQGAFKVDSLYLSYLRFPQEICIGGYPKIEDPKGPDRPKSDSDFPEDLEEELLDIATEILAFATNNETAAQAALLRQKEQ